MVWFLIKWYKVEIVEEIKDDNDAFSAAAAGCQDGNLATK